MFLSLQLYNFRNLENSSIDLSAKEVFFVGQNGQGKSNLLEALYYSSYGNSFRTHVESEIVKKNESEMSVRSMFREENGSIHTTALQIKPKSKKIEKDGKLLSEEKFVYNVITNIVFNNNFAYLFINKFSAYVVDLNAFKNEEDKGKFLEIINNYKIEIKRNKSKKNS